MPTNDRTTCIVLMHNNERNATSADDVVRHALEQRGWAITYLDDPTQAMVELAICERAQTARAAWGLQRAANVVLAIDQPQCYELLLDAVAHYLPTVQVYDCSGGKLRLLQQSTNGQTPSITKPEQVSEPKAQTSATTDRRESDDESRDANTSPSISRDELDMLLEMTGERTP